MNKQSKPFPKWWFLAPVLLLLALGSCVSPAQEPVVTTAAPQSTAEMANPASLYCLEQGGSLVVEERGDGGQFGVCYFEDNRQCEEWALLRGDCPLGGLKVTGYITEAARYCAITGGAYTISGSSGAEEEQGTCTFNDGTQCDAWDYYNGQCVRGTSTPAVDLPTNGEAAPPAADVEDLPQDSAALTARMLIGPNALMGPVPSSFNWSPVGAMLSYVEPVDGQEMLWLYEATSGEKRVLFDPSEHAGNIDASSAQWSPNGARMLLAGDDSLWLLDTETSVPQALLQDGRPKTGFMFTPDGTRVSYVQDNDLYTVNLADGQVQRLTSDGGETVFNGALDWVYNEELATRAAQPAYGWSPDGSWLIYLRLDETAVPNDPVTDYRPVPAAVSFTRYPTAGTPNPVATLHALAQDALAPPLEVPLRADTEYVLPLFTWTPDSNHALYSTVNRDHTQLALNMWTPQSGETRTLILETDPFWINEERYMAPLFLGDGSQFLWLSERDGFMHLYLYTIEGELVRQLTQGEWMIDSTAWNLLTPGRPVHVDPSGTWAYFIATKNSPLERQVYRVNINNGQLEQLSVEQGFHFMALSADGEYLAQQFSNVDTPPVTRITSTADSSTVVLSETAGPSLALPALTREFVTIKAPDGVDLYGQLVKPANFDPTERYPVVVHWYGGPGLQMVSNRYGATNIFNIIERDVLYTQAGFLVWRLDNRGSVGRGHAFETPIFGQLGQAALDDQLAGIEYLAALPYVDAARIATDGKSFGGYMTLYALIHAPDVFRCGVAGAAPSDWSTYDTIYTERYMRTPQQNPDGYAATNLIAKAGLIETTPLLIHGLGDTNVHLQNTVNFIEALQKEDKPFEFVPLPNLSHSFRGDGLAAALSASEAYITRCFEDKEVTK
jgi:dipeptidyl-peptidase-4